MNFPDFKNVKRILRILSPMPDIGGLEISDSAVRFIFIKGGKLVFASVNLPAGTMEDGKVVDKAKLKEALKQLHLKITPKAKKKIYVIVNIPDADIYTQVFNLPGEAIDNFEEAVDLNLRMISPADFSSVYSDWQKVGEINIDGGQIEILSVFIAKKIIDDIAECLKESGFIAAAIEQLGLAVARVAAAVSQKPNFISLHLTAGGLNFFFIKNGKFYFSHFAPWPKGEDRQIKLSAVEDLIISETQKTLNFVYGHWPEAKIENVLLSTPTLDEKISELIFKNFNLPVQKVVLPSELKDADGQWSVSAAELPSLTPDWLAAFGSALRGLIPRSKDIMVSISSAGTEEEFRQDQIIGFARMWRNILISSMSLILIAFISVDIFVSRIWNSLESQAANLANLPISQDVVELQKQAKAFNTAIDLALKAKEKVYNFYPIIEKISGLADANGILLTRVFVPSKTATAMVNGEAIDYQKVIDFKGKLESDSQFTEVQMPLSGVVINSDGKSSFSITFKIK